MEKLAVSVSGGPFSTLEGKFGLLTRIKDCMVFANYVQYRDLTRFLSQEGRQSSSICIEEVYHVRSFLLFFFSLMMNIVRRRSNMQFQAGQSLLRSVILRIVVTSSTCDELLL